MCWSPKIKTPKVDTSTIPEPAPLTEQPSGVVFGGTDDSNSTSNAETTGRKSLTVTKTAVSPAKATQRAFNL